MEVYSLLCPDCVREALLFLEELLEFTSKAIWAWEDLICGKFLIMYPISIIAKRMKLLRFSISSSISKLYFLGNFSFSDTFLNLLT
jgi:hypothetical protein